MIDTQRRVYPTTNCPWYIIVDPPQHTHIFARGQDLLTNFNSIYDLYKGNDDKLVRWYCPYKFVNIYRKDEAVLYILLLIYAYRRFYMGWYSTELYKLRYAFEIIIKDHSIIFSIPEAISTITSCNTRCYQLLLTFNDVNAHTHLLCQLLKLIDIEINLANTLYIGRTSSLPSVE